MLCYFDGVAVHLYLLLCIYFMKWLIDDRDKEDAYILQNVRDKEMNFSKLIFRHDWNHAKIEPICVVGSRLCIGEPAWSSAKVGHCEWAEHPQCSFAFSLILPLVNVVTMCTQRFEDPRNLWRHPVLSLSLKEFFGRVESWLEMFRFSAENHWRGGSHFHQTCKSDGRCVQILPSKVLISDASSPFNWSRSCF